MAMTRTPPDSKVIACRSCVAYARGAATPCRPVWENAGVLGKKSGTGPVWPAIDQGRAVLSASKKWTE